MEIGPGKFGPFVLGALFRLHPHQNVKAVHFDAAHDGVADQGKFGYPKGKAISVQKSENDGDENCRANEISGRIVSCCPSRSTENGRVHAVARFGLVAVNRSAKGANRKAL
jgi:hypothetical protein